jgi:uncharacterized protein (TIGR00251 family)
VGLEIREGPEGVTLKVHVQPRASRDALAGEREGALVVRLTAPPVEGAANEALCRLLARALGVPPSSVSVVSGARGRRKGVKVAGLDARSVLGRLAPAATPVERRR